MVSKGDTDMRCDTCKHWTPPACDDWSSQIDCEFGMCKATPFREDVGGWSDDFETWTIKPEYQSATAIVSDGSGYTANLSTRENHFCAMWQALDALIAQETRT